MIKMNWYMAIFAVAIALSMSAGNSGASEDDKMCAQIAAQLKSSGSNVCVSIDDGVATLSGHVQSQTDKQAAQNVAGKAPGISEVINLITVSD